MEITPIQPNIPQEPKKNWFSKHMLLGIVFLFAVIAAVVSGLYYWQTVSQIPTSYSPIVHKDLTANWKTYTNGQYGFEFKYPTEWILKDNSDSKNVDLGTSRDKFSIQLNSYNNPKNIPLKSDTNDWLLSDYNTSGIFELENDPTLGSLVFTTGGPAVTVAGKPAVPGFVGGDLKTYRFTIFEGNSKVYILKMAVEPSPTTEQNKIFNQILSTFKFTK